ncbi:hypothetical protein GM658_11015 [Pseudoduganella eburnea]|uniref:Blue (type 1) copper domain-containing protein n=1 Tax=Massilia eburnea TaxID=1776165 RepID=A0A6L6QGB2_9BURK|nr:cupredoxin family protein [Massilia eburnea]MTW11134.1 hypothetical protein [Massilia eburnea]
MKKLNGAILALMAGLIPVSNSLAQDQPEHSHAVHQHEGHHDSSQLVGKPGDPRKISRSVNVDMNDSMRFAPGSIAVKAGEVIRFVVKNSGKVKHEMVIGTAAELKEHAQAMAKFPNMEHDEPNQVTLEPGKTGSIVWQFDKAGKVDFACLQPGHFEAGMKGQVVVSH